MTGLQEDRLEDLCGYIRDEARSLDRELDDRNREEPGYFLGRLDSLVDTCRHLVWKGDSPELRANLVGIAGLCAIWALLLEETT